MDDPWALEVPSLPEAPKPTNVSSLTDAIGRILAEDSRVNETEKQHWFNLKYLDSKLQTEFELFQHENFARLGKVIVAEVLLINLIDIGFAINLTARGELEAIKLIWVVLISALTLALSTCHYILGMKRIWLAKIFNCIQTMALTIALTEKSLLLG